MTAAAASSMMSTRGSSSNRACYDLRRNPVYQIDMTAASSGKRVAQTKRRVRWRFGFSNAEALAEGLTGTDCRGEEHDVTLIWSLTSGKRLVLADGKEVHFSMGKATSGKFQTSWTMRGNHVLKIVAYAAPPLKARPGFRQFELFLDGMSFFSMPKIYELGVKAGGRGGSAVVPYEGRSESGRSGSSPRQASAYNNYSLPREEEMAWAQNVERYERERNIDRGYSESAHVQSTPSSAPAPEARNEAPERSASVPTDLVSDPVSSPGQDLLATPPALLDSTPAPVAAAAPAAQDFDFTPQPAQAPPAPTYNDVAGSILNRYGESPAQQTPQQALPALPPSTNYEQPPAPQQTPQQQYYEQPQAQQQPQYYGQQPQPQPTPQAPPQYYEQQQQPPQQAAAAFASPPPQQQYYEQQQPQYGNNQIQQDQYVTPLKDHHQQQQGEVISASPSDAENEAPQTIVLANPADASPTGVDDVAKIQAQAEDDVTLAMKKLCNINDITEKPEVELELTMSHNPFDDKNKLRDDQRKVQKAGYVKSKGLPPTTNNWAMSNKCLAEVKESVPKRAVTKEVMKPHAFDPAAAGAGMMVVYGAPAPPPQHPQQQVPQQGYYQQGAPPQPQQQQQQYYQQQGPPPQQHDYSQGPPPLGYHAAGGFGAGAHLPGGGYANQQVYAAR